MALIQKKEKDELKKCAHLHIVGLKERAIKQFFDVMFTSTVKTWRFFMASTLR